MALSATNLLIGILGTIIQNEGTTIASVRDEVDKIKPELLSMKAFIEDAEAKKLQTVGKKLWVASIRDLAYDVEDIIDQFMYHMYEKQSGGWISTGLHKTIYAPNSLWIRRRIAKKLQKITETIRAIPERNQRYGFGIGGGTSTTEETYRWVQNQVESSFLITEVELVGIEDKKQIIMGWLIDKEQNQTVVSMVGMGGSGKTTLVAKTYTNERVKRHFNCYDGRQVIEEFSTRRLSIHKMEGDIKAFPVMSKIRCLLVFAIDMSSVSQMHCFLDSNC